MHEELHPPHLAADLTHRVRPLVSIVIPFYNEGKVLVELYSRLCRAIAPLSGTHEFEFIWVDDGSRDDSLEVAKGLAQRDSRIRVIELRRNFGQTAALQAGLNTANGELIVSMDADLQHFPEEIPQFLSKIAEGHDVVCGWRHERQEGMMRRWPSRVANWMLRKVSGLKIHDIGTTYRAYRKEIIRDLNLLGENHRFIPIFAKIAGARIAELPIQNIERPEGKSNYGIFRTLNVFLDICFLFFLVHYFDRPIRLFGRLSLLFVGVASIISAWLLNLSFTTGLGAVREHSGWFMLAIFLAITATQLLLTGIISEILVRIYFATHSKTHYRIRKEWRFESQPGTV